MHESTSSRWRRVAAWFATRTAPQLVGLALVPTAVLVASGLVNRVTGRFGEALNIDADVQFHWPPWRTGLALPSGLSALVLLTAAVLWWIAGGRMSGLRRLVARFIGLFLAYMACDEFIGIHEFLGAHWYLYLLPVAGCVGLLAFTFLVGLVRQRAFAPVALFVVGGLCWASAQVLEALQFTSDHQPVPGYWFYVFPEEALEIFGSGLLAASALLTIAASRRHVVTSPGDGVLVG